MQNNIKDEENNFKLSNQIYFLLENQRSKIFISFLCTKICKKFICHYSRASFSPFAIFKK